MTRQGGWSPTGFGQRLRQLREERALTQHQLAERSGCHGMTIAKLERGVQEPAWPLVLALAKALGVTCEAFNGEAASEPTEQRAPGRPPARKAGGTGKPEEAPPAKRGRPSKEPAPAEAPGTKKPRTKGKGM
jgi:transcriptional regulator with XRE-family HTH domain